MDIIEMNYAEIVRYNVFEGPDSPGVKGKDNFYFSISTANGKYTTEILRMSYDFAIQNNYRMTTEKFEEGKIAIKFDKKYD